MITNIYVLLDRVCELFAYDREAGKLRWKVAPSNRVKVGQEAGSIQSNGYRSVRIDGKPYLVHRLIFLIEHGYIPEFVDHIDGNPSNNRIENLRECSKRENNRNRSKMSTNTSGIPGVAWHKRDKKWRGRCYNKDGVECHLGYFTNKHFAGDAVRRFRLEHHQEFAKEHWIDVDQDAIVFLAAKLKGKV